MRIDRMVVGQLYQIKKDVHVYPPATTGPTTQEYKVLAGYRDGKLKNDVIFPPFVYIGNKIEKWSYQYQHTNKIHYILLDGDLWVMDNQFAKHILPMWDGEKVGQD